MRTNRKIEIARFVFGVALLGTALFTGSRLAIESDLLAGLLAFGGLMLVPDKDVRRAGIAVGAFTLVIGLQGSFDTNDTVRLLVRWIGMGLLFFTLLPFWKSELDWIMAAKQLFAGLVLYWVFQNLIGILGAKDSDDVLGIAATFIGPAVCLAAALLVPRSWLPKAYFAFGIYFFFAASVALRGGSSTGGIH